MLNAVVATTLLLSAASAAAHEAPTASAGIVESVVAGSSAAAAGLQAGDRLVRLDDHQIETLNDLREVMGSHGPGDTVTMSVERDGEMLDLSLTFGKSPDGGVSIGIRINLVMEPEAGAEAGVGTTKCLAWIEATYRVEAMLREMKLDLSEDYETMLACVRRDTGMMTNANAIRFCENVFKVHCSGVDLLTEIGEAQVERCERQIGESLGIRPQQYKAWTTCGEQKVFERYSMSGESSDAAACQTALSDECGTNIDAVIRAGGLSPEQQEFTDCCSAASLEANAPGQAGRCRMIDDRFTRGPCHDRPLCINRLNGEWLHCPAPE